MGNVTTGALRLSGGAFSSDDRAVRRTDRMQNGFARTGGCLIDAGLDRVAGLSDFGVTMGRLSEDGSFPGSVSPLRTGNANADSGFLRVADRAALSPRVGVNANSTGARTDVSMNGVAVLGEMSTLASNAMAADVRFQDAVAKTSRLTLGIAQPPRVGGGTATVTPPSQVLMGSGRYSYLFGTQRYSLTPSGPRARYDGRICAEGQRSAAIQPVGDGDPPARP
ncbi:hypothetical protein [uncultured Sphingomonas sp.]|uniref:hypothetical protein n=1 Tax=uncultured Sphingomonas sp. TaxID=158754 RepID=UPI0025E1E6DB|nr:hypothetical protein [uncultured Sphingomonas sp.]